MFPTPSAHPGMLTSRLIQVNFQRLWVWTFGRGNKKTRIAKFIPIPCNTYWNTRLGSLVTIGYPVTFLNRMKNSVALSRKASRFPGDRNRHPNSGLCLFEKSVVGESWWFRMGKKYTISLHQVAFSDVGTNSFGNFGENTKQVWLNLPWMAWPTWEKRQKSVSMWLHMGSLNHFCLGLFQSNGTLSCHTGKAVSNPEKSTNTTGSTVSCFGGKLYLLRSGHL